MVDMVEARKRAKRTSNGATLAEQPLPLPEVFTPAKPVLRSESVIPEAPSAYYPVEAPVRPQPEPEIPVPTPVFQQTPILTETVPEDQVDYIQRLLLNENEDEESELLAESATAEEELELLVFQLGNEHYGISIHQIAEIIRFVEPTDVPNTASFLDGIISLRGKMIPVINGRRRLGHDPAAAGKKTRIVVLSDSTDFAGILVDSASQVVRLPLRSIEPTPPVVVGVDAEFIQGVCEHKSNLIILLNLERFLQFQ